MKASINTYLKKFRIWEVNPKWPKDIDKGLVVFNYEIKSEQLIEHVYAESLEDAIDWLVKCFDAWTVLRHKKDPQWDPETGILHLAGIYPINDGPSFEIKIKIEQEI